MPARVVAVEQQPVVRWCAEAFQSKLLLPQVTTDHRDDSLVLSPAPPCTPEGPQ
jgi:hypothetical protein